MCTVDNLNRKVTSKELSFCRKLWFSNPDILGPFSKTNSVRSNNLKDFKNSSLRQKLGIIFPVLRRLTFKKFNIFNICRTRNLENLKNFTAQPWDVASVSDHFFFNLEIFNYSFNGFFVGASILVRRRNQCFHFR